MAASHLPVSLLLVACVPAGVHSSHRSGLIESESRESVGVRGARVRAQKVASWTASRSECHSCAFHACCAATSRLLISTSTRWKDDWIYRDEFAPITDDNRDTIFGNEVQPKPTSPGHDYGRSSPTATPAAPDPGNTSSSPASLSLCHHGYNSSPPLIFMKRLGL
jgi:hypothetical protein